MVGTDEGKIVLDRRTFKVLASETRIDLLKALDETQKTVSELARELEMNKSTLYQHLERLCDVKLVKRLSGRARDKQLKPRPGRPQRTGGKRKWVYYKLTWQGRSILHPDRVKIAVLLGLTLIAGVVIALLVLPSILFAPVPVTEEPPEPPVPDTRAPVLSDWSIPTPPRNGSFIYRASIAVADDPAGENVTGIDTSALSCRVAITATAPATAASVPETAWQSLPIGYQLVDEVGRGVLTIAPDRLDLDAQRGRYLVIEVTAADRAGNANTTLTSVYLPLDRDCDVALDGVAVLTDEATQYGTARYFTVQVTVANLGTQNLTGVVVQCYGLAPDTDGDHRLDARFLSVREQSTLAHFEVSIPANGTVTVNTTLDAARVWLAGPYVYAVVDPDDGLAETNASNNFKRVAADELYRFASHDPITSDTDDGGSDSGTDDYETSFAAASTSAGIALGLFIFTPIGVIITIVIIVRVVRKRRRQ